MSSMFDELKGNFTKPNNALNQLIIINVVVFVVLGVLSVVSTIADDGKILSMVYRHFTIPPLFEDFIYRPWTIVTYAFSHSLTSIVHIIMNMLVLYWFGRLVQEYLGSAKVVNLYVLGALAGGLVYLLAYNLLPFFAESSARVSGMVGASASVFAISVAAATLLPDYRFHLIFIGPVRIKYIVGVYIFFSFLGSVGSNAGGNIAHLGGAAIGFLYVSSLKRGNDFGLWIQQLLHLVQSLFKSKPKIKVTYRKSSGTSSADSRGKTSARSSKGTKTEKDNITQEEIDAILDKISEKGYESLTKTEKQKLFNASKR